MAIAQGISCDIVGNGKNRDGVRSAERNVGTLLYGVDSVGSLEFCGPVLWKDWIASALCWTRGLCLDGA